MPSEVSQGFLMMISAQNPTPISLKHRQNPSARLFHDLIRASRGSCSMGVPGVEYACNTVARELSYFVRVGGHPAKIGGELWCLLVN